MENRLDDVSLSSVGSLGLGGRHAPLPRGSLTVREARELVVGQPIRASSGVFEADGTVAMDTLRPHPGAIPMHYRSLRRPTNEEIVRVHDEEVVWGGELLAHYGHFLCESVARLWPLLPEGELRGRPVVFTTNQPESLERPFVKDWLEAFGMRRVELPAQGAVRFTKMVVPESAWKMEAWIAPEIRDIHLYTRGRMDVPPPPGHDILWLGRSELGRFRVPYDEALLEWLVGSHVTIVNPEAMTLAEQISTFEGSRAVCGVVGSAFHTMLMAVKLPDCLYLCPPWDKAPYPAQHRFLQTKSEYAHALSLVVPTRSARERGILFPFGFRLLIPEALRALGATVLPALLEDARLASFARPERHWPGNGDRPREGDLDAAVASVLLDPLSVPARMALGAMFEAEGLSRCALEQFVIVADLSEEHTDGPLRAARLLAGEGRHEEASVMAKQALAIDPNLTEAIRYAEIPGDARD